MRMAVRWRLLVSLLAVLAVSLAACGGPNQPANDGGGDTLSGTLNGAGASSQAAAMNAWVAGFQRKHPEMTVNYDPIGSGGGREQFLSGGVAFAGSDEYLTQEELAQARERCAGDAGAVDLPHYISPIAVAYNLPGVDSLELTPEALAGIFAGDITNWTAEAITETNPDADLPDMTINPVHRSDDSGTSANFTDYLSQAAPEAWPYGSIETWPTEAGGEGAQGNSGVVQAVAAGEGSIGYADASQVRARDTLDSAAIKVGDEFVEFSTEAAAKVVDSSELVEDRPEGDFAFDLARDTTEAGVYPIVLVSYHIVCQQYEDQQTANQVKAFMRYVSSEEGQQVAAEAAGAAPISDDLRQRMADTIDGISAAE